MSSNYYKSTTELGLLFPCHLQDAAKFVTRSRDACIVFVKSNVTVKSASEDSASGSMGRNKTSFSALSPVQNST